MPKQMHEALKRAAKKKGLKKGTKRHNAYVYGTMNAREQSKALENYEPPESADVLDRRRGR